jgi:hypothetical protein
MLSEHRKSEESGDFFSSMMFGDKKDRSTVDEEASSSPAEDGQEPQSGNDFFQLFMQIDEIMGSLNELKPVMKEFTPIVDYIKNKLK